MHQENTVFAGAELPKVSKALVMVHGRGARAADILSLAPYLEVDDFALVAPQATGHTWYPNSFMAPIVQNEPWLTNALQQLETITDNLVLQGIPTERIYLLGFSQGACLTLEFAARHAQKWGGIIAFTGGLIGHTIDRTHYTGHFEETPVFIGSSDPDFHVPVERVYATTNILREMGATVTERVYTHMGHTIIADEINYANQILLKDRTV